MATSTRWAPPPAEAALVGDVAADEAEGGAGALGGALDDRQGVRGLGGADRGDAGLDDGGLLRGDLGQGAAEDVDVIEAEAGDGAGGGGDDVGGVEAAAEADFDDAEVDFVSGEVVERERRERFEGGDAAPIRERHERINLGNGGSERFYALGEGGLGDGLAVDLDALADGVQVRRGVEADLEAGGLAGGGGHGADAALALGPRHVRRRIAQVGVAEAAQQFINARKVKIAVAQLLGALDFEVGEAEDVVDCLAVVHGRRPF